MIKINRIDKPKEEEYINESCILRCWKEKHIDKKGSYKAIPCTGFIDYPFRLKEIEKRWNCTVYEDTETGEKYIFAEHSAFPEDFWHSVATHKDEELWPGWNKLEKVPEVWHYRYFIEVMKGNKTEISSLERYGHTKTESKGSETIEIDEETYNRIIKD